jgi:hypothetical protein
MRNLTEEILALPTTNLDRDISRNQVLHVVKGAVAVEIDRNMYPEDPTHTEHNNRILAIVSTAYNLLADYAAEYAASRVRAEMEAAGIIRPDFTDAALFAANKESGEGVTSYHDLAPHDVDAIMALGDIFNRLISLAIEQAEFGLRLSRVMGGGVPDFTGLSEFLGDDRS